MSFFSSMSGVVDCLIHETLSVLYVIIIVVSRAFMSFNFLYCIFSYSVFCHIVREWYERTIIIIESIEILSLPVYTVTTLNFNIHEIYMRPRPKSEEGGFVGKSPKIIYYSRARIFCFVFVFFSYILHHQHVIGKRWRTLPLLPPSRPRNRKMNFIKLIPKQKNTPE